MPLGGVGRNSESKMSGYSLPALSRRTLLASAGWGAALGALAVPSFAAPMADAAPDPLTAFRLIADSKPATVYVDADADSAVRRVAPALRTISGA